MGLSGSLLVRAENLTDQKQVMYLEALAFGFEKASVAQLVEHRFRKPEVKGSSPFAGSIESRVGELRVGLGRAKDHRDRC